MSEDDILLEGVNSYENSLGERERVLENSLAESQKMLQAEAQERKRLLLPRQHLAVSQIQLCRC